MLKVFIFIFAAYGLVCFLHWNFKFILANDKQKTANAFSEKDVYLVLKVRDVEDLSLIHI